MLIPSIISLKFVYMLIWDVNASVKIIIGRAISSLCYHRNGIIEVYNKSFISIRTSECISIKCCCYCTW